MVSSIILSTVLIAIALRQLLRIRLAIWQIMGLGAIAALLLGQISPLHAWHALNLEVISYLFGVFVIGRALELSGYLDHLATKILQRTHNGYTLLALSMLCFAISSAVLMNDTVVIIAAPLLLLITRDHQRLRLPLLLGLAFSVTIGSILTPIGNPQNLLIAVGSNMPHVFLQFLQHFTLPVIVNLIAAYVVLALCYRKVLSEKINAEMSVINKTHPSPPLSGRELHKNFPPDKRGLMGVLANKKNSLSFLSKTALLTLLILIVIKITLANLSHPINFPFYYIALIAALPIILASKQRLTVLKTIDWETLIFFVAMFVLIASVWQSGHIQHLLQIFHSTTDRLLGMLILSVLLSQLISNVPLVALLLPVLMQQHAQTSQLLALAAGSTIAGNLLIIGAASNIIIIQATEKRQQHAFSFWEFTRIGLPITCLNTLVFYFFLHR